MKFLLIFSYIFAILTSTALQGKEDSKQKHRLAICAVFQNESFFLKEWLDYHIILGVDHFYLYDNLSSDNSKTILGPYIESKVVDLIEWPVETCNQEEYLERLQLPVYNHALSIAKKECKWIAFIDLDEFICPTNHSNLLTFVKEYKKFAGIAINWQIFGTSWVNSLSEGEYIIEKLIYKAPINHPCNQYIKMLVQPQTVKQINNPHYFEYYKGYYAVDCSKKIISPGLPTKPVNIENIRINHYWSGTYDWLIHEKIPRREKWGFKIPLDLLEMILHTYNQIKDESILRFLPALKNDLQ